MRTLTTMSMASPLVKQASITAFFAAACGISLILGEPTAPYHYWFLAAVLIMIAATATAAFIAKKPNQIPIEGVIIAADFLAIALLRFATGGSSSIFGSLYLLPLVWMATMPGRRHVWFAALGVSVVLLLSVPLDLILFNRPTELVFVLRGFWSPAVSILAAFLVNELSRISRLHLSRSREREQVAASELDRAASVQRALFPADIRSVDGVSFAGSCVPSRSVGGDFFDWYPIEGGMAITMGDVMGKGVGAGMVAASARAVVRGSAHSTDPLAAVQQLAHFLESELRDEPTFLTLFHGRLDTATGILDYVDAGHGLTLLIRADGTHQVLHSSDMPVGILAGDTWTRQQVIVEPGDSIVSFSDGVLDLYGGRMSAVDEVARIAAAAPSAQALSDAIAAVARQQHNDDDVTIVALRREPVPARHSSTPAAS